MDGEAQGIGVEKHNSCWTWSVDEHRKDDDFGTRQVFDEIFGTMCSNFWAADDS